MNITIEQLIKLKNPNIIDIRSIENYNHKHIPNSINIPFTNLLSNPSKYLKYSETYYIYCSSGIKSTKVCNYLSKQGYNVINVLGGYEDWILKTQ